MTDRADAEARGHEPPAAVNARAVYLGAGALALGIVASLAVVHSLLGQFESTAPPNSPSSSRFIPGAQANVVHMGLSELHAREDRQLSEYSWINDRQDAARIPIDRAMMLAAERNFQPVAAHLPEASDAP